ncbi:MAG: hypothetical protein WBC20_12055 [Candidatus Aminicenantaceae bacterium]
MYKKTFVLIIFLFCAVFLSTCFSKGSYAQEKQKIKKVENVVVISNPKTPIQKNGLKKRIVFKEELSIGSIEGDENYII